MIAEKSGVDLGTVLERIRAMLEAGVVRRVRQTLLSTKLAHGALVAWKVPEEKLNDAFDFMLPLPLPHHPRLAMIRPEALFQNHRPRGHDKALHLPREILATGK